MNRYKPQALPARPSPFTIVILALLLTVSIQAQKRISCEYDNVSLSDALRQLSEQQTD